MSGWGGKGWPREVGAAELTALSAALETRALSRVFQGFKSSQSRERRKVEPSGVLLTYFLILAATFRPLLLSPGNAISSVPLGVLAL